ncbi:MAG: hypothetical protein HY823_03685 [Acidobacteria bacterium]|nr:hypothetical protein [Acidobacteriota bacterium]
MVPLTHLWLPLLLSAVFVFLASSLVHMAFKWHNPDYRRFPNEEEVRRAINQGAPTPGQYILPHCLDPREMASPEMARKYQEGPVGLVWLKAPGLPKMGPPLAGWFVFNLGVALFVGYLAGHTLPPGAPYLHVFRVVGTAAFMAQGLGVVPGSIWMGKPWGVTFKELVDGLIYALLTAGTFGWLWPR